MKRPNFFLVGAAKAGTTSMYHYLNSHPDVFLSAIKEPNYFSTDIDPDQLRPELRHNLDAALKRFRKSNGTIQLHIAHIPDFHEYLGLFRDSGDYKAVGECSVSYLPSSVAAANIHAFNPEARIIIMLRNPIWRAFSQYRMDRKIGSIGCDFETAIQEDLKVQCPAWGVNRNYVWNGMYTEQVRRYFDAFPTDRIHVILFEDFVDNAEKEMARTLSFLGVDTKIKLQTADRFNRAGQPRVPGLNRLIHKSGLKPLLKSMIPGSVFTWIKQWYYTDTGVSGLSRDQAVFLCDLYRKDVEQVSALLARDLTDWVDPEKILTKIETRT